METAPTTLTARLRLLPSLRGARVASVIAGAALAGLCAGHWLMAAREDDPTYEGKPLSVYLDSLSGPVLSPGLVFDPYAGILSLPMQPQGQFGFNDPQAREAIRAVGPSALDLLVRMQGAKDSRFSFWTRNHLIYFPWLRRRLHLNEVSPEVKQLQATAAFSEIGRHACSMAPRIALLLRDPECAQCAVLTLMYIHPTGQQDILALTNVLSLQTGNVGGVTSDELHISGLLALATFGTNAARAEPLVRTFLVSSTNQAVQAAAAVALQGMGAEPEMVVHSVLATLPAPSPQVETLATIAKMSVLASYGPRAAEALPALSAHERSTANALVRKAAAEAVTAIRPGN